MVFPLPWGMSYEIIYKSALVTLSVLFWVTIWLTFRLKVKPHKVERLPRKPRPEYVTLHEKAYNILCYLAG